MKRKKIK
jgi:Papain-like cysteine protease AvrRpt2